MKKLGDERCPAGLVAGAEARTLVAVKVFVEEDEIAPMRIVLEGVQFAKNRPAAVRPAQENAREAAR